MHITLYIITYEVNKIELKFIRKIPILLKVSNALSMSYDKNIILQIDLYIYSIKANFFNRIIQIQFQFQAKARSIYNLKNMKVEPKIISF